MRHAILSYRIFREFDLCLRRRHPLRSVSRSVVSRPRRCAGRPSTRSVNGNVYHENGASSRRRAILLDRGLSRITACREAGFVGDIALDSVRRLRLFERSVRWFQWRSGRGDIRHCHDSFPLNVGGGLLTIEGFPELYAPGETYHITILLSSPTALDWGFQATVLSDAKKRVGKLIVTDRDHTKIVPGIFMTDASTSNRRVPATSMANAIRRVGPSTGVRRRRTRARSRSTSAATRATTTTSPRATSSTLPR